MQASRSVLLESGVEQQPGVVSPTDLDISEDFRRILQNEFGASPQAHNLLLVFLSLHRFESDFFYHACRVARGHTGANWSLRMLACLMVENQFLRIDITDNDKFDSALSFFGVKHPEGKNVQHDVLKQGYTSTIAYEFALALRKRVTRLAVHRGMMTNNVTKSAIRAFVHASRSDCKVTLARYFFSAEEVVDRILSQVRITGGITDITPVPHGYYQEESERLLATLPRYETEIIKRLFPNGRVFWVDDCTSSSLNALVEYPKGSVVLVINLPGSDIEFEIKRVGLRGRKSLDAVFKRDNRTLPPSHRIDGVSMGHLLCWEAGCGAFLTRMFRLAHAQTAPTSLTIVRHTLSEVPTVNGPISLAKYFSTKAGYGNGFTRMRRAMENAVVAYRSEGHLGGKKDRDIALQFLGITRPGQIVIAKTSMYRMDLVADYLGKRGAQRYFGEGLVQAVDNGCARFFVDDLMEEILGIYRPPGLPYRTHKQYIRSAFEDSRNRQRATEVYRSIAYQLGFFWGTLLASRIYTRGESLVARNIGLKSRWKNERWQVELVFMDHDDVQIIGKRLLHFWPDRVMSGFWADSRYIYGRPVSGRKVRGNMHLLRKIYRIPKTDNTGMIALKAGVLKAYNNVRQSLQTNPLVQSLFLQSYVDEWGEWDRLVRDYFLARQQNVAKKQWKKKAHAELQAKGFQGKLCQEYVDTIVLYGKEVKEIFFFLDEPRDTSMEQHHTGPNNVSTFV